MRITIATGPCFPVPAERGGAIPKMMWGLAQSFAAEGHEVTLMARAFPGQRAEERCAGVRILRRGGFDPCRSTFRNALRDGLEALQRLQDFPAAEVTLINDLCLPALLPRLAPRTGRTVIAQQRYPRGQWWAYPASCGVIAPSGAVAAAWRGPQEVRIIPNPVDREVFFADSKPAARRRLLYAGRLHPEKGIHILLDALRLIMGEFPDVRLSLAGPWRTEEGGGGGSYRQDLRKRAEGLPVEWLGNLHRPGDLATVCRQHAFFVYPSLADRAEAFGVAPLEGMACGCVPVVSANPVFRDFIADGVSGFVFDHQEARPECRLAERLACALGMEENALHDIRGRALAVAAGHDTSCIAARYLDAFEEWST